MDLFCRVCRKQNFGKWTLLQICQQQKNFGGWPQLAEIAAQIPAHIGNQ